MSKTCFFSIPPFPSLLSGYTRATPVPWTILARWLAAQRRLSATTGKLWASTLSITELCLTWETSSSKTHTLSSSRSSCYLDIIKKITAMCLCRNHDEVIQDNIVVSSSAEGSLKKMQLIITSHPVTSCPLADAPFIPHTQWSNQWKFIISKLKE